MDDFPAPPNRSQPKTPWFDPICAILMGVASLSTAWCSYQNSRWSGLSGDLATFALVLFAFVAVRMCMHPIQ